MTKPDKLTAEPGSFLEVERPAAAPPRPRSYPIPDPQEMLGLMANEGFAAPNVAVPQAPPAPMPPVSTQPEPMPPASSFRMPLRRATRNRRATTGRSMQINIKATPETIEFMQDLCDDLNMPLGELLEIAMERFRIDPPERRRRR